MSLVKFLIILGLGTVLSGLAWVLVILTLDPFQTGFIAVALFSVSLWLGLVGIITLAGFFFRYWLEGSGIPFRQVAVALRQAVIISSAVIIALLFQLARLLQWWTLAILVLMTLIVEFFYQVGQAGRPRANA